MTYFEAISIEQDLIVHLQYADVLKKTTVDIYFPIQTARDHLYLFRLIVLYLRSL